MELKKQPGVKRRLLQFGQPLLFSIIGRTMYDNFITPAIPFLPKVPFILYSIFMTAFTVLFLLGLVAAIWGCLRRDGSISQEGNYGTTLERTSEGGPQVSGIFSLS